ncbi:hypothetical protein FGF1_20110 [Flavobacteriaceae bacterium GF1]
MEVRIPRFELFDEFRVETWLNISQLKMELNKARVQIIELDPELSKKAKKKKKAKLLAKIKNEKEFCNTMQKRYNFEEDYNL